MTVTLICINDNPLMALAPDDHNNAIIALATLRLQRHHYEQTKNGENAAFSTLDAYRFSGKDKWTFKAMEVVLNLTHLEAVLDGRGARRLATHNPESFPHPGHQKLPGQTQLPRKQLPVSPIPAASVASDRSHPTPAVPIEHTKVATLQDELREEDRITEAQIQKPVDTTTTSPAVVLESPTQPPELS